MSPVFEQGSQGSCTAVAVTNWVNLVTNMDGKSRGQISTQVFYNMELAAEGKTTDLGVSDDTVVKTFMQKGVTWQQPYSYDAANVGRPTNMVAADAAQHTAGYMSSFASWRTNSDGTLYRDSNGMFVKATVNDLVGQISQNLLQGKPLLMSMMVQKWMMDLMPGTPLAQQSGYGTTTAQNEKVGLHMVNVVGLDTAKHDIVVQSWGPNHGDRGLFKINLDKAMDDSGPPTISNFFAFSKFDGVDLTQDTTTRQVALAYNAVLNRAPEASGMKNAVAWLKSGTTLTDLCNNMFNSAEAKMLMENSNEGVVKFLFKTVVDRVPTAAELSTYTGMLNAGTTRGKLAVDLINMVDDASHWTNFHMTYTGTDMELARESARLNNRAQVSQNYAITFQAGDEYGHVARGVLNGHSDPAGGSYVGPVTDDPNSMLGSLVGINTMLGHSFLG